MATTVQDILDQAYNLSGKTQPGELVDEGSEIPLAVHRHLRATYLIGAQVNPTFFGASAAVAGVASVWAEPTDSNLVFYIEDATPAPISIRRLQEKAESWEDPSVYALGRSFYPCGGANDPSGTETLTMYYSKKPSALTALADTLDVTWDEDHNDVLIYALGTYMATKDYGSQQGELAVFTDDFKAAVARYLTHLRLDVVGVVSRFGGIVETSTLSIEDAAQLILGSASGG